MTEITENYRNPDGTFAKGNPGRQEGTRNFTTKVREALMKVADDKGTTKEIELVHKIIEMAGEGNEKMIQLIWNYLDGKPTQKTEVSFENSEVEKTLDIVKQAIDESKKTSTNISSGGETSDNNPDTGADNEVNPIQGTSEGSSDTPDAIRQEPNSSPVCPT